MFNARLCTETFWSPEFFPLSECIVFLPTGNSKNKYVLFPLKKNNMNSKCLHEISSINLKSLNSQTKFP